MKTYWESENTSLVLAAIVLWLRLYHLQNKCISEPKVGQMFTVFYFKETGINAKTECMTIKALQEMEISSLMKSTCNINLIVSNLTISKLSLIYLTIWKQSSIYLTISKPASEKFPRAPASKIWSRSLSSFIEIWRRKRLWGECSKSDTYDNNEYGKWWSAQYEISNKTHACLNKDEMVHNFLYS